MRDTDQDGISDDNDSCPLEPETYNFYQDIDGCPDSVDASSSTYTFPDTDGDGIEDRWDSMNYKRSLLESIHAIQIIQS